MAHFAEIDTDNKVIRVLVGDNNDPNGDEGYQWLLDNLGGTWVKTSYNSKIRGTFAGIGFLYNPEEDIFISPQPYPSWVINETTANWKAPIPKPDSNMEHDFYWDEPSLSWIEIP